MKYLNIGHYGGRTECLMIDNDDTKNSRILTVGEVVTLEEGHQKVVIGYDDEKESYYLERNGEKDYNVQGKKVL